MFSRTIPQRLVERSRSTWSHRASSQLGHHSTVRQVALVVRVQIVRVHEIALSEAGIDTGSRIHVENGPIWALEDVRSRRGTSSRRSCTVRVIPLGRSVVHEGVAGVTGNGHARLVQRGAARQYGHAERIPRWTFVHRGLYGRANRQTQVVVAAVDGIR
uniref:(northern house mosquito) hypothetical protein n=1 Tax=Culex pipiens TaxID=7175 RepID=A0A8D8AVX8_CULPI